MTTVRALQMVVCLALLVVCPEAWGREAPDGEDLAVVGVRAYPSPDATPIDDAVILIRSGRILRVGPSRRVAVPAGYRVVRLSAGAALAGFWNSHVHLTRPPFLKGLAARDAEVQAELVADFTRWGFTTVFDLASTTDVSQGIKARDAEGRIRGPRVLSVAEPFYPPGGTPVYARPLYEAYRLPSAEIRTPAEAARRAKAQIARGADGVKLFTGAILGGPGEVQHMAPDAVRAVTTAAHQQGKPAFAHPTDAAGLRVAADNGVDILAHAAPIMGPWSPRFAATIAQRGVALIPTLSLFADADNPSTPVSVALQQTTALSEAGGVILFGTDAGFTDAFDTSGEMRLMREALGWRGLLASLTTAPARRFGEASLRGRLVPGLRADIVVLGGDPAGDVSAMSDVRVVIRDGRVIYSRP